VNDLHLWIRSETRPTEQRVPVVPDDAARLVAAGARLTVEESPQRIYPLEDYVRAGCDTAPAGSWESAPSTAYVVGIKELPEQPRELRHTHILFAHAFKGQHGSAELLGRFGRGDGELLDLEYLTVDHRRVVAFGRWAGYAGAALGVLALRGQLVTPLTPTDHATLHAVLVSPGAATPSALVIGGFGRSGGGAVDALTTAGCQVTRWGIAETRSLDRRALLRHDLLVNCVVTSAPQAPFVEHGDLAVPDRQLRLVADVTCDVTSEHNLVPVNTAVTTWEEPVRRLHEDPVLDVIAIDNLPSLVPREASASFSAELTPLWHDLAGRRGPWAAARARFRQAMAGI
jgi:saccharopine dehydrogenase (NAD+, L-lysine forming)